MFQMPISSPMMQTMLGFLSRAWAGALVPTASPRASVSSISFCICFMVLFLFAFSNANFHRVFS